MNYLMQWDGRLHHLGLPIIVFVVIVVVGIVIDRWVTGRIKRFAARTGWVGSDSVVTTLSGGTTALAVLIGAANAVAVSPLSGSRIAWVNTVISAASVVLITWMVERVVSGVLEAYGNREDAVVPTTTIFSTIIKLTIYLIGLLVVLHSLGISITPIITALGIGGLAVALALKDTLSNLFAGIQVILSQQITMGDYVQLGPGQEGYIIDITWRNMTIRSLSNSMVIIPNSTVASGVITNFGRAKKELSFSIPMHVGYDSDLDRIEALIKAVIKGMQADFADKMPACEPGIRYVGFGESSINVNAALRVYEFEFQFEMRHEFIKRMHRLLAKEGIHIPFPTREIVHKAAATADDGLE
jgi:small-conductance mechanosensitive channel